MILAFLDATSGKTWVELQGRIVNLVANLVTLAMMQINVLSEELIILLFSISVVFAGLMAGFFFAYSVSVVLALEIASASTYTTVMQEINEKVLNVVFLAVFLGAVVVPASSAALMLIQGGWATQYGQLFLVGTVVYLIGTFAVTMRIHIPMNEDIAMWSPASPPDEWATVRTRWGRWNHIRTIAAILSFVLYLAAIVSIST